MIRLDKFLKDQNIGTRSEVKKLIRDGQVSVNGNIVKSPEFKFSPEKEEVMLQGRKLLYEEYSFYMFNKPAGIITASENAREATVMDYFKEEPVSNLFPVGRLDKDTVGLLLITNHGALGHRMLALKSHVDKVYYVGLREKLSEENRVKLETGVRIGEDIVTAPAKCEIIHDDRFVETAKLTIREGKFHQVKRMFEAVDNEVIYLQRTSFGPLVLDKNLAEGEFRRCTKQEIELLLKLL